ncbi:MAG: hypothetical protein Q8Q09_16625 [Deltaproteobacteria bacterium]|nr:hypothetical protein [Deltaproteobacteria bacterium]
MRAARWSSGGCALCAVALLHCATTQPQRPLENPNRQEQTEALERVTWRNLVEQGQSAGAAGDYTRSEQYLYAAIQRGGSAAEILPSLLHVCVSARRYRAAIEYTRGYLDEHPEAWSLRFLVATIHVGLSEPLSASRHLELVLAQNPNHAEAHFLLASLMRDDIRDMGRADEHFRRYLALEPTGNHAEEARSGLLTRVEDAAARNRDGQATGGVVVDVPPPMAPTPAPEPPPAPAPAPRPVRPPRR